MKLFSINYESLVGLLLPTFLRKPVIMTFLKAVADEFQKGEGYWNNENSQKTIQGTTSGIFSLFEKKRKENLFNLKHNGQVCKIEGALNSFFEVQNETDRFRIEDKKPYGKWLFVETDTSEKNFKESFIIPESEYSGGNDNSHFLYSLRSINEQYNSFIVYYNKRFTSNEFKRGQMREIVNKFRLAGNNAEYKAY